MVAQIAEMERKAGWVALQHLKLETVANMGMPSEVVDLVEGLAADWVVAAAQLQTAGEESVVLLEPAIGPGAAVEVALVQLQEAAYLEPSPYPA